MKTRISLFAVTVLLTGMITSCTTGSTDTAVGFAEIKAKNEKASLRYGHEMDPNEEFLGNVASDDGKALSNMLKVTDWKCMRLEDACDPSGNQLPDKCAVIITQ